MTNSEEKDSEFKVGMGLVVGGGKAATNPNIEAKRTVTPKVESGRISTKLES